MCMWWMGLCLDLGSYSDVWAKGQFGLHHEGMASGTSMPTGSIQVKEHGLGLGFSVWKGVCRKYGYGQN